MKYGLDSWIRYINMMFEPLLSGMHIQVGVGVIFSPGVENMRFNQNLGDLIAKKRGNCRSKHGVKVQVCHIKWQITSNYKEKKHNNEQVLSTPFSQNTC